MFSFFRLLLFLLCDLSERHLLLVIFFTPDLAHGLSEGLFVTSIFLRSPGHFSVFWPILHNAVVWMVSSHPLISLSSSNLSKPLRIVPSAPITTGITVTLIFHNFLSYLAKSKYLPLCSLSSIFALRSADTVKIIKRQVIKILISYCCYRKPLIESHQQSLYPIITFVLDIISRSKHQFK